MKLKQTRTKTFDIVVDENSTSERTVGCVELRLDDKIVNFFVGSTATGIRCFTVSMSVIEAIHSESREEGAE